MLSQFLVSLLPRSTEALLPPPWHPTCRPDCDFNDERTRQAAAVAEKCHLECDWSSSGADSRHIFGARQRSEPKTNAATSASVVAFKHIQGKINNPTDILSEHWSHSHAHLRCALGWLGRSSEKLLDDKL